MSQGYQPEKQQGTPLPPPKNPNALSAAAEKQAMIVGIYAFVAAVKGQELKTLSQPQWKMFILMQV